MCYSGGGHGNPLQYSCLENPHGYKPWGCSQTRAIKHSTCVSKQNPRDSMTEKKSHYSLKILCSLVGNMMYKKHVH